MGFIAISFVCLSLLFQPVSQHPIPAASPAQSSVSATAFVPTLLEIPAIKLTARVDKVGLLPNHNMGVPKTFDRVGLLYPGFLPGQNGNAVIDGHVDHYTGPAVFFYLKRLKQGDQIIVSDDYGKHLKYTVTSVEAFKTKEAPLGRIFGAADRPHLNLITCTGHFDRKKHEHEQRLVVFTELSTQ